MTENLPAIKKFYCYTQNNSGGSFVIDEKVAHFVFIEAMSAAEADQRAMDIGIYFGGVAMGLDCDCCGDRWYEAYDHAADPEPKIYDRPIEQYQDRHAKDGEPYCHVYYLDGLKKTYRK